jgi:hypothetical protein
MNCWTGPRRIVVTGVADSSVQTLWALSSQPLNQGLRKTYQWIHSQVLAGVAATST